MVGFSQWTDYTGRRRRGLFVIRWSPTGDGRLYPEFELAEIVKEELGLDIAFSEAEHSAIIERLEARVKEKMRRDTPEWKAAKAKRLQAKARALANREDSTYVSCGTAAALSADTAASDPAGLGAAIEAGVAGEELGDGGSDDEVEQELELAREEEAPLDSEQDSALLEQGRDFELTGLGSEVFLARFGDA